MQRRFARATMLVMPLAGALVLCSCASDQKKADKEVAQAVANEKQAPAATQPAQQLREPGGVVVQEMTTVFTVYAVDKSTRVVTLKGVSGDLNDVKCGPEVVNFDQIAVGDEVKFVVVKRAAIFVRPGTEATAQGAVVVERAPKGAAQPSATVAETVEVTAKINAIDTANRIATLTGPQGNTFTVPIAPDVDLSKVNISDVVVVRYTTATKIALVKAAK